MCVGVYMCVFAFLCVLMGTFESYVCLFVMQAYMHYIVLKINTLLIIIIIIIIIIIVLLQALLLCCRVYNYIAGHSPGHTPGHSLIKPWIHRWIGCPALNVDLEHLCPSTPLLFPRVFPNIQHLKPLTPLQSIITLYPVIHMHDSSYMYDS